MKFPCLQSAVLVTLVLGACSREVLDELPENTNGDGSVDEPGGGDGDTQEPSDGGDPTRDTSTSPDMGMSCSDSDRDGVCNADDNCPDDANKDQADDDGDGVGNACTEAPPCEAEAIGPSVTTGSATFSNIKVNGNAGPANVKAGSQVTVAFDYNYKCGTSEIGNVVNVAIGLEGTNEGTCVLPGGTSALVIPTCLLPFGGVASLTDLKGSGSLKLVAPSSGIVYPVIAGTGTSFVEGSACDPSLANAQRVAALCVQ